LLLYYRGITSKSGQQRIGEVIAHEIAHQWFGNLVTPQDWKYLWLNESFATYFGYGVAGHYYPQWDIWEQFLHGMTAAALRRDGLRETTAIEIPGGEHVVINTSTAPIIYNKGGSILRQIEGYIGRDNFRKGLRHYLNKHAYGVAASQDLWESFESASERPVRAMMKSWIEQAGYPIVAARRQGAVLRLKQERFTYLPNDSGQQWLIPIAIRLFFEKGQSKQLTVLMEESEKMVTIPADAVAYKINDGQNGFYRVDYRDESNLERLGRLIDTEKLSPEDRWGVQNDLFAQVERGDISVDAYLQFLGHYDRESAFLPLAGIVSNLSRLYLTMNSGGRETIGSWARPRYETILERIGYEPSKAETSTISILREQLIWQSALLGSANTIAFGCERFVDMQKGAAVDSDLMRCVLQVAALSGDESIWDWLDQRFQHSVVEHERLNILTALGCFKDKRLVQKTQAYILNTVPPRNKSIPVEVMAANPHAAPLMWDWYVSSLAEIERFHPLIYERVLAAVVPTADIRRADEVKAFFSEYLRKTDKARDVIRLSLEKLEINARLHTAGPV